MIRTLSSYFLKKVKKSNPSVLFFLSVNVSDVVAVIVVEYDDDDEKMLNMMNCGQVLCHTFNKKKMLIVL